MTPRRRDPTEEGHFVFHKTSGLHCSELHHSKKNKAFYHLHNYRACVDVCYLKGGWVIADAQTLRKLEVGRFHNTIECLMWKHQTEGITPVRRMGTRHIEVAARQDLICLVSELWKTLHRLSESHSTMTLLSAFRTIPCFYIKFSPKGQPVGAVWSVIRFCIVVSWSTMLALQPPATIDCRAVMWRGNRRRACWSLWKSKHLCRA